MDSKNLICKSAIYIFCMLSGVLLASCASGAKTQKAQADAALAAAIQAPVTLKLINPASASDPIYAEITAPAFKNTPLPLDIGGLIIPYSIVNLYDKNGGNIAKLIIDGNPRLSKYFVNYKFNANGILVVPLRGVSMSIFTSCFDGFSKLYNRELNVADIKNIGYVTVTVVFQTFNKGDEVPTLYVSEKLKISGEDFEKKFYHYNPGLNPQN